MSPDAVLNQIAACLTDGGNLLLLSAVYFFYQSGAHAGYFPPVPYIGAG